MGSPPQATSVKPGLGIDKMDAIQATKEELRKKLAQLKAAPVPAAVEKRAPQPQAVEKVVDYSHLDDAPKKVTSSSFATAPVAVATSKVAGPSDVKDKQD